MNNLYLHIGCGKTGSSALQVWLANNAESLKSNGYFYPLFGMGRISKFTITCGNGVPLRNAIVAKNLPDLIDKVFTPLKCNVIFSSEVFQDLEETDVNYLNTICNAKNIKLHIIAYVRDVYDITYSSYLQLIKKRSYTSSFSQFALERKSLQQFQVVSLYEKYFNNLNIIHYDTEKKRGIDKSFCRAIGLDSNTIPSMNKSVVNRSLTIKESQLVIMAKKEYFRHSKDEGEKFSSFISNSIIAATPERKTEILYVPEIEDHFKNVFGSGVRYINEKYLDKDQLKIFDPTGKKVVKTIDRVDPDLEIITNSLVNFFLKEN